MRPRPHLEERQTSSQARAQKVGALRTLALVEKPGSLRGTSGRYQEAHRFICSWYGALGEPISKTEAPEDVEAWGDRNPSSPRP